MSTATSPEPLSIAEYAQSCLKVFQVAQNSFANTSAATNPVQAFTASSLLDESSRFRLWCGNIGAHRRGKSSLDHKLREASHIKDRVVELLQRIQFLVEEIDAIVNERKIPWDAELQTDSEESEDELEDDEDGSSTELQQLASSIGELITNLMQLSSTIRNPAPHDQFKRSQNIDTSHFEGFDIQHVQGKYPRAEQFLVTRMGRAISRRRLYLRYREEHRARLAEGLDAVEQAEGTVASSIPPRMKSGISAAELEDEDDFDDHASQTSYASSMSGATTLRPPPLPKDGQDGKPFECPLCHYFTTIGQGIAWEKHVYADLQPYVCTFENCTTPDRTYESRREWFSHELQEHRRQWNCIEGCSHMSHSQEEFQAHLRNAHNHTIADRTVRHAPHSQEIHKNVHGSIECALCQTRCSTLKQLRSHLGRHQRELSLFALPSRVHEDDVENENSEDEDENGDSEDEAKNGVAEDDDENEGAEDEDESEGPEDDDENGGSEDDDENAGSENDGSKRHVEIFKSFRVNMDDPCYKVLPVALEKYKITEDWRMYALYIVHGDQERCIGMHERPMILFKQLDKEGQKPVFMLRKHPAPEQGHINTVGSDDTRLVPLDSGFEQDS